MASTGDQRYAARQALIMQDQRLQWLEKLA
jgi:hypothetical protein